jgi:Protein of unknown function (DUF2442)
MIRIKSAEHVSEFTVRLTLTNGSVVERDLARLLVGRVFAPVRKSPRAFAAFRVEGGTLTWPNGADLCPDVILWGGPSPTSKRARPAKRLTPTGGADEAPSAPRRRAS